MTSPPPPRPPRFPDPLACHCTAGDGPGGLLVAHGSVGYLTKLTASDPQASDEHGEQGYAESPPQSKAH